MLEQSEVKLVTSCFNQLPAHQTFLVGGLQSHLTETLQGQYGRQSESFVRRSKAPCDTEQGLAELARQVCLTCVGQQNASAFELS